MDLVEKYLESKKNAWAPSTLKSERARLKILEGVNLEETSGGVLWNKLLAYDPYSRCTAFTRVSQLFSWGIDQGLLSGPNPFAQFREENARLFRNNYIRTYPKESFEEAKRKIATLPSPYKEAALTILTSGLRISELRTLKDGKVIGKGNKTRAVYGPYSEGTQVSQTVLRRHLATIGLKPHSLRKLAATEFYRRGLSERDMMEVFGWNSFETAKNYVKPLDGARIKEVINGK